MKSATILIRRCASLGAIVPFAALLCGVTQAPAAPLLGSDLASFAVLGATPDVTNTGATTLTGDVGVSPAASITGQATLTVDGINALLNPTHVHLNDATAISAQLQLVTARNNLASLGPGTPEPATLGGLILAPGVYSFASAAQLTGTLTLNGEGNANAAWVFLIPSALTTASASAVNVIDTGAGAGVYWDVGSTATLGTTTSFEGNILASTSVILDTGATIGCGRALAHTADVTMDTNTINATDCAGTGTEGSLGLSGGLDVTGTQVSFLPFAPLTSTTVPEPSAILTFGLGLVGLFVYRKKRTAIA